MKHPLRKPDHRRGGLQVRICGQPLGKGGLICQFPAHHPSQIPHSAVGYTETGAIIAAIKLQDSGEVMAWQLVAPHE